MSNCRVSKHFPFLNAMSGYIVVGCSCGYRHPYSFHDDPQGNQMARLAARNHRYQGKDEVFKETSRLVSSPSYAFEVNR